MKCHQTLILSLISSVISTTAFTNTFDTQLNDITQQHQQAKDGKSQPKPDIRLNISPPESLLLSYTELPCYPIHQWAFDNSYIYSGESETDKRTLFYLIYRDSHRKTTISTALWSHQSQNYIDKSEIEVQKRRMAGWDNQNGKIRRIYYEHTTFLHYF